jgi:hypothetical protein
MLAPLLALLLSGCIVAVDDAFCVAEPVSEIIIDVRNGNVVVSTGSDLCVEVDVGGISATEVGHHVENRALYLDYDCTACGGDIAVTAPRGILIDIALGSGDLRLEGRGGDVFAAVGTGEITAVDLANGWTELATGAGSITATWTERPGLVSVAAAAGSIDITVPTGIYFLDLQADVGEIEVSGISESDDADAQIAAITRTGSIEIRGR